MQRFFQGPEAIVVILLIVLLFGGSQLPKIARNLGLAQKEFKKNFENADGEDDEEEKPKKKAAKKKVQDEVETVEEEA